MDIVLQKPFLYLNILGFTETAQDYATIAGLNKFSHLTATHYATFIDEQKNRFLKRVTIGTDKMFCEYTTLPNGTLHGQYFKKVINQSGYYIQNMVFKDGKIVDSEITVMVYTVGKMTDPKLYQEIYKALA